MSAVLITPKGKVAAQVTAERADLDTAVRITISVAEGLEQRRDCIEMSAAEWGRMVLEVCDTAVRITISVAEGLEQRRYCIEMSAAEWGRMVRHVTRGSPGVDTEPG